MIKRPVFCTNFFTCFNFVSDKYTSPFIPSQQTQLFILCPPLQQAWYFPKIFHSFLSVKYSWNNFVLFQYKRHSVMYGFHGNIRLCRQDCEAVSSFIMIIDSCHKEYWLSFSVKSILFLIAVPFIEPCYWYHDTPVFHAFPKRFFLQCGFTSGIN